jgi:glycosyltransferase involved in cell wall biosynthesis
MQKGLVSVVIPTYNRSRAVVRAIESVLAQDYEALEILVVDDGSRDDTAAVLRRYEGHPKIRVFFKANGGVASARNRGIHEARGEYVAMLDSDDAFLPGKLRWQVAALEMFPEAGLVWSDMRAVSGAGGVLAPRYLRTMYQAYRFFPSPADLFEREEEGPEGHKVFFGDIFSPIILGNIVHTSTLLVRAERIRKAGPYDSKRFPARKPGEDHDFHLRLAAAGPVAFLDAVTIDYVVGAGDAITSAANNLAISLSHLEHVEHAMALYGGRIRLPRAMLTDALSDAYGWAGQTHFYEGDLARARRYLLRSLGYRPLRAERWKYLAGTFVPKPVRQALGKSG